MGTAPTRVLLVDDDEDEYVLLSDLLSGYATLSSLLSGTETGGFELEWVGTYDAALETMARNEHDVCLVDYRLGERSGLELLSEAAERGCNAPMILLTGQGDREVDIEAMKAGAADYLDKSELGVVLLERSIRYAIEHKRMEDELLEKERRLASVETLRRTLMTLSHHVNNAMTAISGNAQMCELGASSVDRLVKVCMTQTDRISAVLRALNRMVEEMDIRTVDYVGIQDAMFDIEEELKRTLKET